MLLFNLLSFNLEANLTFNITMKKTLLTLALAMASYCSYAQTNTFPGSGNVGIGTNSPSSKLDIIGGVLTNTPVIDGVTLSTTNANFTTKGRIASNFNGNYITQNASYNGSNWLADNTGNAVAAVVLTANGADGNIGFYTSDVNNAGIGNLRMLIDKNGNVGIGTTSPTSKFDLTGLNGANDIKFENYTPTTLGSENQNVVFTGSDNGGTNKGNFELLRMRVISTNGGVALSKGSIFTKW
jgi:hypothetical protein